jgi:hypothetical protein
LTVKQLLNDNRRVNGPLRDLDDLSLGYLLGILAGEGHFGGDGRQPQITLRMHTRHRALFHWLVARFPGGALYGPYHHGGRSYYQWLVRGSYLRQVVAPLIQRHRDWLDDHVVARFDAMCHSYEINLDVHAIPRRPAKAPTIGTFWAPSAAAPSP